MIISSQKSTFFFFEPPESIKNKLPYLRDFRALVISRVQEQTPHCSFIVVGVAFKVQADRFSSGWFEERRGNMEQKS